MSQVDHPVRADLRSYFDNEIAIGTREVARDRGKLYSDRVRRWRRKT